MGGVPRDGHLVDVLPSDTRELAHVQVFVEVTAFVVTACEQLRVHDVGNRIDDTSTDGAPSLGQSLALGQTLAISTASCCAVCSTGPFAAKASLGT